MTGGSLERAVLQDRLESLIERMQYIQRAIRSSGQPATSGELAELKKQKISLRPLRRMMQDKLAALDKISDLYTASIIIETAQENSVDLIVLGVSRGEIVAEWMNAGAMERTDIPVLLIPKWVRGAGERRRMAERKVRLNS